MYRNRLEILLITSMTLCSAKYFVVGVYSWLTTWLNKYNYREYIKKITISYNPLKKVLLRHRFHKGSVNRNNWLVCKILNLVKKIMNFSILVHFINPIVKGFVVKFNQVCVFVYFAFFSSIYRLKR